MVLGGCHIKAEIVYAIPTPKCPPPPPLHRVSVSTRSSILSLPAPIELTSKALTSKALVL